MLLGVAREESQTPSRVSEGRGRLTRDRWPGSKRGMQGPGSTRRLFLCLTVSSSFSCRNPPGAEAWSLLCPQPGASSRSQRLLYLCGASLNGGPSCSEWRGGTGRPCLGLWGPPGLPGLLGLAGCRVLTWVWEGSRRDAWRHGALAHRKASFSFRVYRLLSYLRCSSTSGSSPEPTQCVLSFHISRTYKSRQ